MSIIPLICYIFDMIKNKINLSVLTILACFLIIISFFSFSVTRAATLNKTISGYIFLQVEEHGEAWYIYPANQNRYYLGRPADAFEVMKKLSLGTKHDFIVNTEIFPDRLSGLILLDTESHGEAYYIYPLDHKKYYLGRPIDAWQIMRELGRGITNADLLKISTANINDNVIQTNNNTAILLNVPFTSQAPYGNWNDQRLQDGCEEASALMAIKWTQSIKSIGQQEANETILAASDYLLKKYGEYRDITAADAVNWIYKDYFNYQKVSLKQGVSREDIIAELKKANIVVAPMNGQVLGNPYFTPPGPEHHVLVIRGYDSVKDEFITNDPGTKHGELYRYDSTLLFNAIRNYPTGYQESFNTIKKDIIVIWK
ncbi:hypothetical protein COT93_00020 [Candidatus Falkowbacteria bacterium CG10_big_fil_rev_8_21_14_0_10_37_18]|uniref:Peptidase C39-like domain-containing protein n=1 Tax=Candidatus Falkowbacteria bacterium CG10_big_fil_rev_8_21_14_0_10_37_18 TaxID=1974562 RepID=A0A2H0V9U7_9BACT|nr:MAG: hypothetical protein COT93_00020 [Candidatus Falkowbacteria bacterium CG10_big_fil_rev_8_21_14_0_10_37_18]